MASSFKLTDHLSEVLGIPCYYLRQSVREDRIEAAIQKSWLKSLLRFGQIPDFSPHESLGEDEVIAWMQQGDDFGPDWRRLYLHVLMKQDKLVIPLPRLRSSVVSTEQSGETTLSFAELLHYVSQTNNRNLWKDMYKRHCPDRSLGRETNDETHITLVRSDVVMRDIIARTYGCPIISSNGEESDLSFRGRRNFRELEPHSNTLPAFAAVETDRCFIILHPFISHTLQDCVSFSPTVMGSTHTKPLFIVYQLLQVMCSLHDRGLVLGDVTLSDILLTENLWIQVLPHLEENIHEVPAQHKSELKVQTELTPDLKLSTELSAGRSLPSRDVSTCCTPSNEIQIQPFSNQLCTKERCVELERACYLWVSGRMSNLDYLTLLNRLSGRRRGDPNCHHVLPWVTDFTAQSGLNWRDLTKSKFRLNKGDRQLDLTYDVVTGNSSQVPHHVSDVLSDITYYVYLSRRTPRSVLCKVVRSVWVPAEYPSSIQRLQEWTPDECIPEFFTDPSVFKSIHEDLPNLEVPSWASGPEDFIERHREMLESTYVSERLNHWIDLTFGYKLSGAAAVKAKNVCLHLVDSHTTLSNCGVVQLFTQPHPQRMCISPYWGKVPPRVLSPPKHLKVERESGDEDTCGPGFEEEDLSCVTQTKSSPLALSRLLSRSRGSLLTPTTDETPVSSLPQRTSVSSSSIGGTSNIILPRDFNPIGALQALEALHSFTGKTFHHGVIQEHFHNKEWECREGTRNKLQVVASKRLKEMQVLGCLLVELFLAGRLRPLGGLSEQRLQVCQAAVRQCSDQLPRCVRHVIAMLLQVNISSAVCVGDESDLTSPLSGPGVRYPTVTTSGLPPPSAHQLLQPLLSSALFPFPPQFHSVYTLLKKTQEYASLARELSWRTEGINGLDSDVHLLMEKLSECWVKSVAHDFFWLVPQLDLPLIHLALPHVRQLLEDPNTAVLAAWYLFDPVAQALGPAGTSTYLLDSIVKLYNESRIDENRDASDGRESAEVSAAATRDCKQAKLYHRSFLLKLMVRLDLRTFLDNFVAPLVEAVGGYHEVSRQAGNVNCTGKRARQRRGNNNSSTHLQSCELDEPSVPEGEEVIPQEPDDSVTRKAGRSDTEGVLSPTDEDLSGGESELQQHQTVFEADGDGTDAEVEPEMFVLDTDEDAAPLDSLMDQLDLHQDSADEYEESFSGQGACLLSACNNGPKSPIIPIPGTSAENGSCCGSLTSGEVPEDAALPDSYPADISFASIAHTEDESHDDGTSRRSVTNTVGCKVSDLSADSLLWLAHRLGPVLSARHLSRNLLRMLTLCYLRADNLQPVECQEHAFPMSDSAYALKIVGGNVVGDKNAEKVLECLSSIAALYGEQLIVLQYLPHISELIAHCRRKLTPNLEAGLVGCLALLRHIIPYMTDNTLMDQLQDTILKMILHPAVRLLSTTRLTYPSGWMARLAVASKFCDALYLLAMRLGREMTHRYLAVPALQRFFLTFSKAHVERVNALARSSLSGSGTPADIVVPIETSVPAETVSPLRSLEESSYLEIRRDGTTTEWAVRRGIPVQITHVRSRSRICDSGSADSYSPPVAPSKSSIAITTNMKTEMLDTDPVRSQAQDELRTVFSSKLAHLVYIPFFRFLGEPVVEQALKNHLLIRDLCFEYEQEMQLSAPSGVPLDTLYLSDYLSPPSPLDMDRAGSGSFGTNVALIGNRIELQRPDLHSGSIGSLGQREAPTLASLRMESNSARHLRGNWLAYWEHEIGRAEKDTRFNFKQIKLQTFAGHSNSIRSIVTLGNENSFLSASRDKTVKLWSLRSQGDGSTVSQCQWSYSGHRKSILSLSFIESLRLVASCDSVVQLWDPWLGRVISSQPGEQHGGVGTNRSPPPVNVIRALPAPSSALLAATTDSTIRMLDARLCLYVNQLKVSLTPVGLIRCVAVGPSGNWAAIGQSSGFLTILDIRTGLVIASWKGHEGEVLQLVAVNDVTLVSSSLDQAVSVWNAVDGKLRFHLKGPTEPVHCLAAYGSELISGTTANRIGVHTAIDSAASFSSTRLRSDTFRGVLTTMAVLPLNRLLLLGADNGTINLLC